MQGRSGGSCQARMALASQGQVSVPGTWGHEGDPFLWGEWLGQIVPPPTLVTPVTPHPYGWLVTGSGAMSLCRGVSDHVQEGHGRVKGQG